MNIDTSQLKNDLLSKKIQIEKNLEDAYKSMTQMRNLELNDEADHAAVAIGTDIDSFIIEQQRNELTEIELALDKIRKGTYGICEMCEDNISIERLNVKSFARYCIACREINEKEHH